MTQITGNIALIPPRPAVKPDRRESGRITFSPLLAAAAQKDAAAVLAELTTSARGLSQAEAERRLVTHGPNAVAQEKQRGWPWRLLKTICNPLVVLLTVLAVLSAATGDLRAATVVTLMILLGIALRFVQETRADTAAAKLKAMITVTATVVRDGLPRDLPLRDLVPGDVVSSPPGTWSPPTCGS